MRLIRPDLAEGKLARAWARYQRYPFRLAKHGSVTQLLDQYNVASNQFGSRSFSQWHPTERAASSSDKLQVEQNHERMGWLDNLEKDLNTNFQNSTTNISTLSHAVRRPSDDYEGRKGVYSPGEIFVQRVTICGLEEACSKKSIIGDKIMFRMALLIAFAAILYESYAIASQYRKQKSVFNDQIIDFQTTPFPNVTVCFPWSGNDTLVKELMQISMPKKASRLMERYNFTMSNVINYMKDVFSLNVNYQARWTPLHLASKNLFDNMVEQLEKRGQTMAIFQSCSCQSVLSNCEFEGKPFDCCQAAIFLTLWHFSCFQIDLNGIDRNRTGAASRESIRLQTTGFTVDVSTDWTYGVFQEGSASDGFYIFVDRLPSQTEDPIAIPAGMDAVVSLAEPHKTKEITQCRDLSEISNLKYFDYYDPYGTLCMGDNVTDYLWAFGGCVPPVLSHFPRESCTFNQMFLGSTALSKMGFDTILEHSSQQRAARIHQFEQKATDWLKSIISYNPTCKPLCSRWTYRIVSTSYGIMHHKDDIYGQIESSNLSQSRIRFILPQTSWNHNEEKKALTYLAICDVGGMMGAYASFSMITFVQVAFYGYYLCQNRKLKERSKGHVTTQVGKT